MKRRILSFVLSIFMLLSFVPNFVYAQETHNVNNAQEVKNEGEELESKIVKGKDGKVYTAFSLDGYTAADILGYGMRVMSVGDEILTHTLELHWVGRTYKEFPFPEEGIEVRLVSNSDITKVIATITYTKDDIYQKTEQLTDGNVHLVGRAKRPKPFKEAKDFTKDLLNEGVILMLPYGVTFHPELFASQGGTSSFVVTLSQKANPLWTAEWNVSGKYAEEKNKPNIRAFYKDTGSNDKKNFVLPKNDNVYSMQSTTPQGTYWDGENSISIWDESKTKNLHPVLVGEKAEDDLGRSDYDYTGALSNDALLLVSSAAKPRPFIGFGTHKVENNTGFFKADANSPKFLLNTFPSADKINTPNQMVKVPASAGKYLEGKEIPAYRALKRYAVYEALNVKFNTGAGFLSEADKTADKKEQDINVTLTDEQITAQTIEDGDYVEGKKAEKLVKAQTIGYNEKIKDNESGREIIFPVGSKLVAPAKADGQKTDNEFKGWNTDKDAKSALSQAELDAIAFTADTTTFYAIYGPKAEGKVKVKYQYYDKNDSTKKLKDFTNNETASFPTEVKGSLDVDVTADALKAAFTGGEFPTIEGYTIATDDFKLNSAKFVAEDSATVPEVIVVYVKQEIADKFKDDKGNSLLVPQTISLWEDKTDTNGNKINWKDGVNVKDAETTNKKLAEELKKELAKDGASVKDLGKDGTKDAPKTARNSSKANVPDGAEGNLLVTFADNSFIVVNKQMLYVWAEKTENNDKNKDKPKPDGAVQVSFVKGTGITKLDPANKTMTVKPNTTLKVDEDFPAATVDTDNGYIDEVIWSGQDKTNAKNYTVTDKNKVFTATANKDTSNEDVIPYEPTDPKKPTDPKDKNIPTEDKDHKTIDKKQYVIVAFNVTPENSGKLTLGKITDKAVISALVKKDTEWAKFTMPTTKATSPYSFWYWSDAKAAKVTDGEIRTAHFIKSGDEIKPGEKDKDLPDDFFKVTVAKGEGVVANALYGKTYAVKKDDKLAQDKFPTPVADKDYKEPKWDVEKPWEQAITTNTTFTASATNAKFDKNNIKKIEYVQDPDKMNYFEGDEPKLDGIKIKLTDKDGNTVTIGKDELTNYGVKITIEDDDIPSKLTIKDHDGKKYKASVKGKNATGEDETLTDGGKNPITVDLKKPVIDEVNEGDKKITGKGTPGSEIEVKINDSEDPIKTDVDKDGNWSVEVPKDNDGNSTIKGGDKITVVEKKDSKIATAETTVRKKGNIEVEYPTSEIYVGDYKTVTPEIYGTSTTETDEAPFVVNRRKLEDMGVTVKAHSDGRLTIEIGENYRGPKRFTIDLDVYVDGQEIETYADVIVLEAKTRRPEAAVKTDDREVLEHKAYIFGYPDGSVRPQGNITRAEAAAMIARLLNIEAFGSNTKPMFPDTPSAWYNRAINAVVQRGIMKGYPDGSFKPNDPITRAEFTTMIAAIDNKAYGVAPFADVKGHWAELAIGREYQAGRINGYPDGTFRPQRHITRAEAATILNKIFDRCYDAMSLIGTERKENVRIFTDLYQSFWGYNDMVEATNNHSFKRRTEGRVEEDWVMVK